MSEPTPEELSRTLEKMRLANRRLANYRKGITSLAPLVGKIPGNVWEKLGAAETQVEDHERRLRWLYSSLGEAQICTEGGGEVTIGFGWSEAPCESFEEFCSLLDELERTDCAAMSEEPSDE